MVKQHQPNPSRLLLAKVRGGNYAHAGDKEATKLVLAKIANYLKQQSDAKGQVNSFEEIYKNTPCLDVGAGFGGTADYFYSQGFDNIQGIDINQGAIEYAASHYPYIKFSVCDVVNVHQQFNKASFSVIYLFNTFYALQDPQGALRELAKIAKPEAILVIFDYTHLKPEQPHGLYDLDNKPMHPIVLSSVREWLAETGWEILEISDLSKYFIKWYKELVKKLEQEKTSFVEEFSNETVDKVQRTYISILETLQEQVLGGTVIYARKK